MPRKTSPETTDAETDGLTSKSARTRERLLDAAATVLARKGFAGTRLSDIAERAHVQAPAIYYYYSSREELIEEVVYTGAAAMRTHLTEALAALPRTSPPSTRIATAVEAHLRNELEISDYSRAIIRNGNQLPDQLGQRALAEVGAYNAIWRDLITELAEAGQLRGDITPSLARMLVLGALNWTPEWWRSDRGSIDEVIHTAQSMILHALRP